MKNKEFVFEFKNDWKQLIGKWNWYSFTFVEFYVEHEKWLKAWNSQFTILGLGVYIRLNYDVAFLTAKLKEWEDDPENKKFLTDEDEELDETE
jgi:hypothetical protein